MHTSARELNEIAFVLDPNLTGQYNIGIVMDRLQQNKKKAKAKPESRTSKDKIEAEVSTSGGRRGGGRVVWCSVWLRSM